MKPQFTNKSMLGNERGQAIVFGALFMVGLLVIGGFAVDTAHVFLVRSKVQRAADASALAAITRYANGETEVTTIEQGAEDLARYNLIQMGIEEEEIQSINATLTVDANRVATLDLETDVDVPTFFMRFIPEAGLDMVSVNGDSTSRRVPAIISLVFDVSGSMSCNGGCPEKLQALKDSAITFINSFEEDLDEVAITVFSYEAEVIQPMAIIDKDNLETIINNLDAGGWTNISDGLALGRQEIEATNNPEAIKALVLFSDGAPNTMSPFFLYPKSGVPMNYPSASPQYYHYIVEGATRRVKRPVTLSQICSQVQYCFSNYEYMDSRLETVPYSSDVDRYSKTELIKESFDISIVESDYAKSDGISVYTIGLGTEDPETGNAYQSPNDGQTLKPILLRRIANDPESEDDPQFAQFPNSSSHPAGIYLQTPENSELSSLFQTVAQRLKLRLIE